jgi:mRNA interferase MazF
MNAKRGDVVLVNLDPVIGSEIKKRRPCVVVSADELNVHLNTLIVAPMTTQWHPYPFRVKCGFQGRNGYVVLDQIRTIDQGRITSHLGRLSVKNLKNVFATLQEMFAE